MAQQREWFEKDYYAVLGVDAGASDKDIQRAYRKLAKQYHPDANEGDSGAEERFKEISAAHDVLGDAERRKEYDEVRQMVASGAGPGGFGPGGFGPGFENATFRFDDGMGLGDLFGGLFANRGGAARGRGRSRTEAPQRGADLESELHLDFLEAVHGATTSVGVTSDAACSVCGGSGAEPGTMPTICPACGGSGAVAVDQGPFSFSEVCPRCAGRGRVIEHPCKKCKGSGVERRQRDVKVRIPAGVSDGQRIKVKGRGAAGRNGAPPGDLYVEVHVKAHPILGRSGRTHLTLKVPITFAEAALGAQVKVPTLDAPVTVKVPPGTQSGTTVRVRGRGIAAAKGDPGDLLVTFDIVVPSDLSDDERAAIRALGERLTANPREDLGV